MNNIFSLISSFSTLGTFLLYRNVGHSGASIFKQQISQQGQHNGGEHLWRQRSNKGNTDIYLSQGHQGGGIRQIFFNRGATETVISSQMIVRGIAMMGEISIDIN
jgi:hypothetical protein